MRRLTAALVAILVTLAVAGCGDATFTLKRSVGSDTFTVVANGDPNTISAVRAGMPAGSTTDGDGHSGNKICEADVNDAGRNYHVVLYSTASLPASICDSFRGGING